MMPETRVSLPKPQPEDVERFKINSMGDAIELAMARARDTYEEDPDQYGYGQEIENELGIDILDPDWKAKPDDTRWVHRIKARARRAMVSTFYMKGYNIPDIAKKVKVSEATVYRDLESSEREWRKTYLKNTEVLAGKAIAQLNYMMTKLEPQIDKGDTKAIIAALELIKEQGQILGYRTGVQVDIEQYVREVAESAGYDPDKAVLIAQRISISMK